ncbi:hypothetical protein FGO68_gene15401 [Halteria grandinella]|uniref:UNC93-like protein MFSD11 n=1 Tax=Halteria grandinella TaxID=5974 RepID=A0A8J8T297_HALGN|nr:hypothetical protein FGO68_gene15401 [Halteria grandinella]
MSQGPPSQAQPLSPRKESLTEQYPNLRAVLILSGSFFVLFMAFFSAANSASKALKDSGFGSLGFFSLSMLYLNFGLASLWTPRIIKRLDAKLGMVVASLFYALWIISLAMTTAALKSEAISAMLSYNAVVVIVLSISFVSGAGCSMLWIAQGKYLSDCAEAKPAKKGFYNSLFWFTMFLAQVSSSLLNAFVLGSFSQVAYLFVISTGICILSTICLLVFLPDIRSQKMPATTQQSQQSDVTMWSMMGENRMIQVYGLLLCQALSLAIRQGGMVPFISDTIQSTDTQEQFKLASLASAMFGIGQLVGSPMVGYVNDHLGGGQAVARTCLVVHLLAYSITIVYNEIHSFGFLSFVVTFLFGMQDAALQTQVTIVLGFEFRTNVEPFAIYRLLNSLAISGGMAGLAFIIDINKYRVMFCICFLITLGAQGIMAFKFAFQNRKTQRVMIYEEVKQQELQEFLPESDKPQQ